jgi:hypothetical protein
VLLGKRHKVSNSSPPSSTCTVPLNTEAPLDKFGGRVAEILPQHDGKVEEAQRHRQLSSQDSYGVSSGNCRH